MAKSQTAGRIRALIKRMQAEVAKKLEEDIKKHQEAEYIEFEGGRVRKTLIQRIPATKEEKEKYERDKKDYDNKKLNSYIDKVFFEDGALADLPKEKKSCAINLKEKDSYIDKVFFEDGGLQFKQTQQRK